MCIRYIKSFHDHAMLNTTQGYNLLEECQKIKGVSRIAAQVGCGFFVVTSEVI